MPPLELELPDTLERITLDESRPHVTAVCPFCTQGQTYTAGFTTTGIAIALHYEPRCSKFDRLDVTEFLKAARLAGARVVS